MIIKNAEMPIFTRIASPIIWITSLGEILTRDNYWAKGWIKFYGFGVFSQTIFLNNSCNPQGLSNSRAKVVWGYFKRGSPSPRTWQEDGTLGDGAASRPLSSALTAKPDGVNRPTPVTLLKDVLTLTTLMRSAINAAGLFICSEQYRDRGYHLLTFRGKHILIPHRNPNYSPGCQFIY